MNSSYTFAESVIALRLIAAEKAANANYLDNIRMEMEVAVEGDIGEHRRLSGCALVIQEERRAAVIVGEISELLANLSTREAEIRRAARGMTMPVVARAPTNEERISIAQLRDAALAYLRHNLAKFAKLERWPSSPLRRMAGK